MQESAASRSRLGAEQSWAALDPSAPTYVGSPVLYGPPHGVVVRSDIAYVSDYNSQFRWIDVSTPSAPELLTSLSSGHAKEAALVYGRAYVANWLQGLAVVDVSGCW